ncbi:hypothetical protein LWI28_008424 [Acer negundo]|uniref:Uncharacterized protein n=1 Tax=Acer negundo TaxID=4023 RepID=A0AAD5IIQ8_ACENE|nr:hypothetical protein LWI28_008424 [Acer negundo]
MEQMQPRKAFGWAARDSSGVLSPFTFSRRATGEKDVKFKVLYCGICHSDLHFIKNEWEKDWASSYPLVPGHEIGNRREGFDIQSVVQWDMPYRSSLIRNEFESENQWASSYPLHPGKIGNKTYEGTTWQIIFQLESWKSGNYKLQLALASATEAEIQVRFNDVDRANRALFSTGLIGKDNAIARHGIHGLYKLYTIDVPSSHLQRGNNTLYLTQSRHTGAFQGVMYDYIRLEGPTGN